MSKSKPVAEPKRGRPPIPEHERRRTINATVAAATRTYLERIGGGSASAGMRLLADYAARENLAVEGAKTPVS